MEEINLNLSEPKLSVMDNNDNGRIKISVSEPPASVGGKKSVNFGPGAEMLMNPNKQKTSSPKSDINLSDLNSLDDINLEEVNPKKKRPSFTDIGSNLFSSPTPKNTPEIKPTNPSITPVTTTPLNKAVEPEVIKTDDGFKTFNDIPVNPNLVPEPPKMTQEEILREKLSYLRKLEALEKKGITLTKKYSMESPLAEMKGEYEMIKADKEKQNSVKFQQKILLAFVSGLEFLNNKFDPFDLKLDG